MAVKVYNEEIIKQYGTDPRHFPIYGLGEASRYLKINPVTLRSWIMGRNYKLDDGSEKWWPPVIELADSTQLRLSFFNLVEVHVLSAIRRVHKVRFPKVRSALNYLKHNYSEAHPLANRDFWTDRFDLFIRESGDLICASQFGQQVIKEAVDQYLTRVERDLDLSPLRLYPFSREIVLGFGKNEHRPVELKNTPKSILIDPLVAFGRPTLAGTGIPTNVIAGRFIAGENSKAIARDYDIEEKQVKEALDYEEVFRRAA